MVKDATTTSKRNRGARGIYTKVNNRSPNFRAGGLDLYGSWYCNRVDGETNTMHPATVDPVPFVTDLVDNGLVDKRKGSLHAAGNIPIADQHLGGQDIGGEWGKYGMRTEKSMATYGCKINAPDAEWSLRFTCGMVLMNLWRAEESVRMYRGVPDQPCNEETRLIDNVEEELEDVLNNMMMATGMLEKRRKEMMEDVTQGCLVDKAWIPWQVVFLFVLAAILLFGVAGYAWYLLWRGKKIKQLADSYGRAKKETEDGKHPGWRKSGWWGEHDRSQ
ncbi:hypothetical protein MKZ38_006843 [Zalerion maritima]|uniref:Uncharacterized protein n=1 Tax=Zalerion maritima TaxID=339359 RepID=A0AAD5RN92_9PEZI|nr:hypothetical protein MKZ38_006843 [Zalerion maritima]